MEERVVHRILLATGSDEIVGSDILQPLWNQYGFLRRVFLAGGTSSSVIVKHIQIPQQLAHPRGFASSISRDRKIRSYEVETHWYRAVNASTPPGTATARCLDVFSEDGELFLLLEDLHGRGYVDAIYDVGWTEMEVVLGWLARFHAAFLGADTEGLWETGTYWHLATRPEELERIEGTHLHRVAGLLDARLRCGRFSTIVHGDAKLANFLFRRDRSAVAAVDFQYVGRGSAMQDVAYFVGSCWTGDECERREDELLDAYFAALRPCLPEAVDAEALETEWRELYPVAWADFQRFLLGWSPGHRKLTDYSDRTTERAIAQITDELLGAAREACLAAGSLIERRRHETLVVESKGMSSPASDVVTEVDRDAQALIAERLAPTLERYDLGLLAEEGEDDQSRLAKHAFWAIDPLDGTQRYVEGRPGYATSIALVSRSGRPLLAVVYDPANDRLFEAVAGQGVRMNGEPLPPCGPPREDGPNPIWFADASLRKHARFADYDARFDIRFVGGAVVNALHVLTTPGAMYVKAPKLQQGGCAIWDVAAVALFLEEHGGTVGTWTDAPLDLNRAESVYFNDVGLAFFSPRLSSATCRQRLAEIHGP